MRTLTLNRFPDSERHMQRMFEIRNFVRIVLAMTIWLGMVVSARAQQESGAELSTLEGLVGEWAELRTTLAAEKREWEERKSFWVEEIGLLEKEIASLREERDEIREFSSSVEEEREALLKEKETLTATLEAFRPVLDRMEVRLRREVEALPEPLAEGLVDAVTGFPASSAEAAETRVVDRVQKVASVMAGLEELHNGLHSVRQVLQAEGGTRREVNVLYAGLARGFAVSADGEWAAVGVPGEEAWTWRPRPELAERIRSALAVMEQRTTAKLVTLPMGVAGEESE